MLSSPKMPNCVFVLQAFCGVFFSVEKNGKGEDAGVGDRRYEQEREKGRELSPKNSLRRRSRSKGRKGKR